MAENGEFQTFHVDIPMPGRHMVSNALAAAAVGRLYGLNAEQIKMASKAWNRSAEDSI